MRGWGTNYDDELLLISCRQIFVMDKETYLNIHLPTTHCLVSVSFSFLVFYDCRL